MSEKVGLVGYGIMGAAMAPKLIGKGYEVLVYDVSADAASRARRDGCTVCETLIEVAQRARVVVISLPKPEHVTSVVREGNDCLLAGASEGSVFVDTSTVDPETSRRNAEAGAAKGVGYLDSPVLGRPSACGNWTLPTGGEAKHIRIAEPVLESFAAKIVHVGASGQGNTLKLLNNLMFGTINSITCEIFALGERLGMEPKLLFDTISNSGAGTVSKLFQELGPKIVAQEFTPNFTIDNMHKDVGLGLKLAEQCGMTLAIGNRVQEQNKLAQEAGLGREDTAALVKIYQDASTRKGSA